MCFIYEMIDELKTFLSFDILLILCFLLMSCHLVYSVLSRKVVFCLRHHLSLTSSLMLIHDWAHHMCNSWVKGYKVILSLQEWGSVFICRSLFSIQIIPPYLEDLLFAIMVMCSTAGRF